ncbi:MAG: OmpA family protein [Verrucomicrobiota bacterium]
MAYEDEEREWGPLILVVLLILGLVGAGLWLVKGSADELQANQTLPSGVPVKPLPKEEEKVEELDLGSTGVSEETAEETLEAVGVAVDLSTPEGVAQLIGEALESGDLAGVDGVFGNARLSAVDLASLQRQAGAAGLRLAQLREVGELEIQRKKRFALEWESGPRPLFLDIARGENGKWQLDSLRMPDEPALTSEEPDSEPVLVAGDPQVEAELTEGEGEEVVESEPSLPDSTVPKLTDDALTVSDAFLLAALVQDFGVAKSLVDTKKVSDAKIAALCIIFEEAKYQLDPKKPLRAMFNRENNAGYLANVLTGEEGKPAQFGINLARNLENGGWQVTEINLDALLADYANRVAGGDVYYTPLVPKPSGGDTLVLFFDFDEAELAPRTLRQLEIVTDVLKTDGSRTLTIAGHADALGSDEYNRELSARRAEAVRGFLAERGVNREQILTRAEGESRPNRPNETETGEDNPDGRRANRRTEIYLDF